MEAMRVAFFGGTFDPIHRGHLAIASAAAEAFGLDRVLFAPVGRQPLKPEAAAASFEDRLAMVSLACAEDARFAASTLDAPRAGDAPNFTVDTLDTLLRQMPGATLFVLAGADSFLDLRRWHSPERLLELAEWIVVSRPEFPLTDAGLNPLALSPMQRARVHLLTKVHEEVSASELRNRLRHRDRCPGLIAPAVYAYIESHGLYR